MKKRRKRSDHASLSTQRQQDSKKWLSLALFASQAGSIHIPPLRSTTSHSVPPSQHIKEPLKEKRKSPALGKNMPQRLGLGPPRHCGQVWGSETQKYGFNHENNANRVGLLQSILACFCPSFTPLLDPIFMTQYICIYICKDVKRGAFLSPLPLDVVLGGSCGPGKTWWKPSERTAG